MGTIKRKIEIEEGHLYWLLQTLIKEMEPAYRSSESRHSLEIVEETIHLLDPDHQRDITRQLTDQGRSTKCPDIKEVAAKLALALERAKEGI